MFVSVPSEAERDYLERSEFERDLVPRPPAEPLVLDRPLQQVYFLDGVQREGGRDSRPATTAGRLVEPDNNVTRLVIRQLHGLNDDTVPTDREEWFRGRTPADLRVRHVEAEAGADRVIDRRGRQDG